MLPQPLPREERSEPPRASLQLVHKSHVEVPEQEPANAVSPGLWIAIFAAIPPAVFLWWLVLYGLWASFV